MECTTDKDLHHCGGRAMTYGGPHPASGAGRRIVLSARSAYSIGCHPIQLTPFHELWT